MGPSPQSPLETPQRKHGSFQWGTVLNFETLLLVLSPYFPFNKYQTKTDLNIQYSSISLPFVLPSSLQFLPTSFSFWLPVLESLKTFFGLSPKTVIFFSTEGNFTAGSPDNIGRPFRSLQLEEGNTGFLWVEIKTAATIKNYTFPNGNNAKLRKSWPKMFYLTHGIQWFRICSHES